MTILISQKARLRIDKKCGKQDNEVLLDGYEWASCDDCGAQYPKFKSTKIKVCCSCRETRRLLKHGSAVVLQPGYPVNKSFSSFDDVKRYLAGDEITCLLCGNGFQSLPPHLRSIHGMSADEYKEMFGITYTSGLVSGAYHELRSEECKEKGIGRDGESLRQMRAVPRVSNRPMNDLARSYVNERITEGLRLSQHHITKKTDAVDAYCSDCGGLIDRKVTEYAVIVQSCRILCSKCKRQHYLASQKRYRDKRRSRV